MAVEAGEQRNKEALEKKKQKAEADQTTEESPHALKITAEYLYEPTRIPSNHTHNANSVTV